MTIQELQFVLHAPDTPVEVPRLEQFDNEQLPLRSWPSDYLEYLDCYGTGSIDDFLWIFNVSSKKPYLDLSHQSNVMLESLRELGGGGILRKFHLFPEPGGLFPIGITDNGDGVYWNTAGIPDDWTIVLNAAREATVEEYNMGLIPFLIKLLKKEIRSEIFPPDFPSLMTTFKPFVLMS